MAISRTPMTDDDGSGLTGTPFNNAWKQELYGQIDASAAFVNASNDFQGLTQTFRAAAPSLYFVETDAVPDGKVWLLQVDGSGMNLYAQGDTGVTLATSLAMNRTGDVAIGGKVYERARAIPMGTWATFVPSFSGFTLSNLYQAAYTKIGTTCIVNLYVSGAIAGATAYFYLYLPAGTQATGYGAMPFSYTIGAGGATGMMRIDPSNPSVIGFAKDITATLGWADGGITFAGIFTFPIAF